MCVVKHLYEYGNNQKFNILVKGVLSAGKSLARPTPTEEETELLNLMHIFQYHVTDTSHTEISIGNSKNYNICLEVCAAGSGMTCTKIKPPKVFLNNKSGHYKCDQFIIEKYISIMTNKKNGNLKNLKPEGEFSVILGRVNSGLSFAPVLFVPNP